MNVNSTAASIVFDIPSYDPCSNYTFLNQSWRGTNETGGSYCDSSLNWSGWYRLLYNGMSVRMPESCVVTKYLDMVLNTQEKLLKVETTNPEKLVSYGNAVLNKTEKLVSTLVKPTETNYSVNISRNGLDIQVFAVGPKASMKEVPQLSLNSTQLEIDLIEISTNNNDSRSAAVAFMSYANMGNMLSPNLFNTTNNTVKTMMSTVVSATLPKTTNTRLTKPVNFTMKHIEEIEPNATLSCVYWKNTEWVEDGCYLLQTNSSHTVCSSEHLSTFALIMQINPPSGEASDPHLDLLSTVLVAVGLMFLSLTLLTFALCRRNLRVNNTSQINLCISLLLAHLLFLLTQSFLQYIQPDQLLCAVLAGVLHFLFLSAFVWMFIEAVLLFISVKNLTKIRSKQKEILGWKCLIVIGYIIPLVVVGVSVGLFPDGYGSPQCWIKTDRNFVWSFLGPVCFILTVNVIIFVFIIFTLRSALARLNSDLSQIKQIKVLVFKILVQSAILGCPWILGFFVDGSKVLEMVFLFLNSQQGTFIFLVYCVLNRAVSHCLLF
ncbi:adhesion G protein-coupled receptor E3-like [Salminus brasiliensis]|uniref:adhesion G protein-coupled receptor E3-like n=1 Tax=Salminus brasiliensis TaxID=930266 RepID=UPI003B830D92